MKAIAKLSLFTMLLALTLGLTGCVKFRQTVTVMPDGSGMFEIRVGMSEQLIASAQQNQEDPFADIRPEGMQENMQGIVAFSEPTTEEVGGYTYLTYLAYFQDINQVRVSGSNDGEEPTAYSYTRDGDSATLTVTHGMIAEMAAGYEKPEPSDAQMIRAMMAGLVFEEHYVMPGNVSTIDGIETEDNHVRMQVTVDNAVNGDGLIETLADEEALTFEVADVSIDEATVTAFQAELAAAIEAWQARQAQDN